jgi:hypothetical protein
MIGGDIWEFGGETLCLMTRGWWPQVKSSEPADRSPKQETHCTALYLISWNIRVNGLKK